MRLRHFFLPFLALTGIIALLVAALQWATNQHEDAHYAWLSLLFFVFFSLGLFFISLPAARSKDKNLLLRIFIGSMLVKMLGCVAIAVVYQQKINSPSRLFVVMFLGIYVLYTIFETYFMMALGKVKS